MPIAEIIHQIDEYLSRLRQARELLSTPITEAPQESLPGRKRKVLDTKTHKALSTRRADGDKTRSNRAVARRKKLRENVPAAQVLIAAPLQSSHAEPTAIVEPQSSMLQNVVITKVPSRRRTTSNRAVRRRIATTEPGSKPDAIKPAIALAGPLSTKVVVVSAEQVKRERERAAPPEVQRPRVAASGLSGRRAFEALFKDESSSSGAR